MIRMVLHLFVAVTLAVSTLHSPSLLHADEPEHAYHVDTVRADHQGQVSDPSRDHERGTFAHDHHVPAAMTVALPGMDMPMGISSGTYPLTTVAKLPDWPAAPPPEPPSA